MVWDQRLRPGIPPFLHLSVEITGDVDSSLRSRRPRGDRRPLDLQAATEKILNLIGDEGGVRVLISRRKCALVKAKEEKAAYRMRVDPEKCLGEACGCARICTWIFKCPGLIWNKEKGKSQVDEVICSGCGVCADICPRTAILREEN